MKLEEVMKLEVRSHEVRRSNEGQMFLFLQKILLVDTTANIIIKVIIKMKIIIILLLLSSS